jgi:rubrerythrin
MPNDQTIAALFELAITAEEAAQDFYLGLVEKFSHLPTIADFWQKMMEDEVLHVRALREIRASLTPDQFSAPVEPAIWWKAKEVSRFSVQKRLNSVKTLEDAYQSAHYLEYSEINTVFEFLLTEFTSSDKSREFIASQLRDHVEKLTEFSETFGDAVRRSGIVARSSRVNR